MAGASSSLPRAPSSRPPTPDLPPSPRPIIDAGPSGHPEAATVPAVIEWAGDDGQSSCYLGHCDANPVHLVFYFDASTKTTVLRLSIVVALRERGSKPFRTTEPLYLCLLGRDPSRLRHLSIDDATASYQPPPDEYLRGLLPMQTQGSKPLGLSVELASPADLVAPGWPLTPRNNAHGEVFDSVRLLARQTAFRIHVREDPSVPVLDTLVSLCASVSNGEDLRPHDTLGVPGMLYHGRFPNAKVVSPHLLMPPPAKSDQSGTNEQCDDGSSTQSPPDYDTLDPPPPEIQQHSAPSSSRKRRRVSSSSESNPGSGSGPGLGASPGTGPKSVMSSAIGEQMRAYVEMCRQNVADAVAPMALRVEQLEQRVAEVERERDEAKRRIGDLELELESLDSQIEDRVWVEVDELQTSISKDFDALERELRGDVREYVEEQMGPAVSKAKRQLANADVSIIEGRLEVNFDDEE
ncbi:hypothetical protein VPNG_10298 [Cytospora leucostoma]|uniref:Uncharacterized protein n=1 Tax=Cytospora leucostoma TaxID=1230097 RepID=A0A423VB44_9PEZI|nr:hypothetical protein VPNG_10298 [Cytospora leucostoma]